MPVAVGFTAPGSRHRRAPWIGARTGLLRAGQETAPFAASVRGLISRPRQLQLKAPLPTAPLNAARPADTERGKPPCTDTRDGGSSEVAGGLDAGEHPER